MEVIINKLPDGTLLSGKSYQYRVVKALGQGSFGITYLATVKMVGALGALDSNMYVCIKEFFMKGNNGRQGTMVSTGNEGGFFFDYKRKFMHEASNLSRLHHPGIIKVDSTSFLGKYLANLGRDVTSRISSRSSLQRTN